MKTKFAGRERQQAPIVIVIAHTPRAANKTVSVVLKGACNRRKNGLVNTPQLALQRALKGYLAIVIGVAHSTNASLLDVPGLLTPMRALLLGTLGLVLQGVALLPAVDNAVETNASLHYLQHGLIFAGGVCMGIALRDLLVMSRRR